MKKHNSILKDKNYCDFISCIKRQKLAGEYDEVKIKDTKYCSKRHKSILKDKSYCGKRREFLVSKDKKYFSKRLETCIA